MITKFKSIQNLAVFKDFKWDENILDKNGVVLEFKKINIIYGQNHSGKTTLSRIVKSLEQGCFTKKIDIAREPNIGNQSICNDPTFEVEFNSTLKITQEKLFEHGENIMVFNKDFVEENIPFLIDDRIRFQPGMLFNEVKSFLFFSTENEKLKTEIELLEIQWKKNKNQRSDVETLIREKLSILAKDTVNKINSLLPFNHICFSPTIQTDLDGTMNFGLKIIRGEETAYNLSEGEASIIAFCYFIAKLDDIENKNTNPIIWIDDPISSLDNNHIFYTYSVISQILANNKAKQLFISTHNLDFLKYLKRLTPVNSKEQLYFTLSRIGNKSTLKVMPKHLENYSTEFNFLFNQIYRCAKSEVGQENIDLFYSFGNNTRKFLEIYLFYRYPNFDSDIEKYKRFFGDAKAIMINRIVNEYSHLQGLLEKGMAPIEVPEMKQVAQFIIDVIEEKDPDQYSALLESI